MSVLDGLHAQQEATILVALVRLAEVDPSYGDHCIDTLRAIGHERTALIVEAQLLREQSHSVKA